MKTYAAKLRQKNMARVNSNTNSTLSAIQIYISIASSIAIPIVLAVSGYYVQKSISQAGLKKDYVQIAVTILKENATSQDKELRRWAIETLDKNAEIPFSKSLKNNLVKGIPITLEKYILPNPPQPCMRKPERLKLLELIDSRIKGGVLDIGNPNKFVKEVLIEAKKADAEIASLDCLQSWISMTRDTIGDFEAPIILNKPLN